MPDWGTFPMVRTESSGKPGGMKTLAHAGRLADATPTARNRTIDFLRALAIVLVVAGHWLVAAPYVGADGGLDPGHMLEIAPWTRGLTWVVQVMPLFFVVGGYSNAASWRTAHRSGTTYRDWLTRRMRRLLLPVLPLLLGWVALAAATVAGGVDPAIVRTGSQVALVPVWFLAVYVMIVAMAPAALAAWDRWGWASFAAVGGLAVAADVLAIGFDSSWAGWTNYAWVWLAAHMLGFAWRDDRLAHPVGTALTGGAVLAFLVGVAGYPFSMVGVPGDAFTNTFPPTVALLALGVLHTGVARMAEPHLAGWLEAHRPWTATILVNGSIMTLYLWHLTAMALLVGASVLLGGAGLHLVPDTATWWWSRPLWIAILAVATLPFLVIFTRLERGRADARLRGGATRVVVGAAVACIGLALLALDGIVDAAGDVRWIVVALPFVGAVLAGVIAPTRRRGLRGDPAV